MAYKRLLLIVLALLCTTGRAETFLITSDLHLTRDASAHEAAWMRSARRRRAQTV